MALKVPFASLPVILQQLVAYFNGLKIKLYKNNHTPADADTVADYTEADFDGYASKNLTAFGAAFLNASNKGETDHTILTWTDTGAVTPNSIYGYYVTTAGGALLWAEKLSNGPITMQANGDQYSVIPAFTFKSEF